jgi:hypothetical protein
MHIPGSYEEEDTCMHAMTQAAASIVAYDQHQRPAHAQVSWTEETSVKDSPGGHHEHAG